MSDKALNAAFKNKSNQHFDPKKNEGDYVAHPLNIFKPSTWDKPGHGTENYGAAKAAREAKAVKRSKP